MVTKLIRPFLRWSDSCIDPRAPSWGSRSSVEHMGLWSRRSPLLSPPCAHSHVHVCKPACTHTCCFPGPEHLGDLPGAPGTSVSVPWGRCGSPGLTQGAGHSAGRSHPVSSGRPAASAGSPTLRTGGGKQRLHPQLPAPRTHPEEEMSFPWQLLWNPNQPLPVPFDVLWGKQTRRLGRCGLQDGTGSGGQRRAASAIAGLWGCSSAWWDFAAPTT